MKKRMNKKIAMVCVLALMMTLFAGCNKTECEWCGEKKRCETVYLSLLGEKNICEECEELVSSISDHLKPLDELQNNE